MSQQIIKEILPKDLLAETIHLKNEGYRLVAITCTNKKTKDEETSVEKDEMELSYSFDKDYDLINLRFSVCADDEIESVSLLYSYAFLYENEIKELFGVSIKDISLDFNNTLYKIPVKAPFHTQKEDK
ncbi:MAG TPA: NADH-quinone oxidoreductase subunit C [Mobilitalea sp.]|nr:NADH-quinone oxidoreductase subunit C [Mobilitalea sp.]